MSAKQISYNSQAASAADMLPERRDLVVGQIIIRCKAGDGTITLFHSHHASSLREDRPILLDLLLQLQLHLRERHRLD